MADPTLSPSDQTILLDVARTSIGHGLAHGRPYDADPQQFDGALTEPRASFVTLKIDRQLRGCIGRLEPDGPLVCGVSRNAFAAAFQDPRFAPLTEPESRHIRIHVSVLSLPTPMTFTDEEDLLSQLRPGVDGLVLEAGRCRGTFLPAVWQTLPEPKEFLGQLKVKAGLHPNAWPADARVLRYTSESFGQE
jgi:AmmeMemoRadiSam system protein A